MAEHPWLFIGAGVRQCDACKKVQRLMHGLWEPEYPRDCPNMSDDDDGDNKKPRKPRPKPLPPDGPDRRREPPVQDDVVDAYSNTFLRNLDRIKEIARAQREADPDGTKLLQAAMHSAEEALKRNPPDKIRLQLIREIVKLEGMLHGKRK